MAAIIGKSMGLEVGIVSALPWACALAAVIWIPWWADRIKRPHILAALVLAVSGAASTAFLVHSGALAMAAICVAASGFIAVQPVFWIFPTGYLSGRAAAGGIAVINTVGALGGFVAPNIKVWSDRHFHSPSAGLYVLAGFTLLAAALIALLGEQRHTQSHSKLN